MVWDRPQTELEKRVRKAANHELTDFECRIRGVRTDVKWMVVQIPVATSEEYAAVSRRPA